MSAPRFDPTAAKALIAESEAIIERDEANLGDTRHGLKRRGMLANRKALVACLSSAISAIEGPEDGAGEIAEDLKARIRAACCGSGEAGDPANYCAPFDVIFLLIDSALATRAPSESAVTDEMAWAAMRVEHGKTLKKRPRCMDHLVSLYREMIEAALAASPTPEETKI